MRCTAKLYNNSSAFLKWKVVHQSEQLYGNILESAWTLLLEILVPRPGIQSWFHKAGCIKNVLHSTTPVQAVCATAAPKAFLARQIIHGLDIYEWWSCLKPFEKPFWYINNMIWKDPTSLVDPNLSTSSKHGVCFCLAENQTLWAKAFTDAIVWNFSPRLPRCA